MEKPTNLQLKDLSGLSGKSDPAKSLAEGSFSLSETTIKKAKVLLLNPPGKKQYLRDYYCNNISKSRYLHYPVDLLLLTGTLADNNYEVSVIDALIKRYTPEQTLEKIKELNPDYLVCLVGSLSWEEDKEFLSKLKTQNSKLKIIGTGDVFLDEGKKIISENGFFDGCILDFSDDSILKLLEKFRNQDVIASTEGAKQSRSNSKEKDRDCFVATNVAPRNDSSQPIDNCIYKENGSGPIAGGVKRRKGEFSIPLPRHEYFPLKEYKYAFSRNFPTAHLLTDFGCAFNCSFCPIRIDNLGFKVRSIDEIIKELKYLKSLGIKELYFRDQTFGANKKRAIELCKRMVEEGFKFSWYCFSRVDVINEELLDTMKESGCHTIIFGVESVNEKTLQDVQKRINAEKIKAAFELCKKKKIRRAATFIIGLPGETEEDIMRTVDFAIEIDCTFASFNVATIRPGTEWSHNPKKIHFLPEPELERIRNNAIKKFYIRPGYILNRITEINTPYDINVLIEEGLGIVANLFKSLFRLQPKLVRDFE